MEQIILTSIPLEQLIAAFRNLVREELVAAKSELGIQRETGYSSRKQVAEKLQISLPTLNELTKSGKLPAYRIGRHVLYKTAEVDTALSTIKAGNKIR